MALDSKMRELVSIGVSVAINCQPCLDFHVKRARELDVTNEEMAEAVRVARDMKVMVSARLLEYAGKVLEQEILGFTGPQIEEMRTCC